MRVTVIPADRWIRHDDAAMHLTEWPFDDSAIHAIQWYDDNGEIEYTGKPKPPNQSITDDSVLAPYLLALNEAIAAAAASADEMTPTAE